MRRNRRLPLFRYDAAAPCATRGHGSLLIEMIFLEFAPAVFSI